MSQLIFLDLKEGDLRLEHNLLTFHTPDATACWPLSMIDCLLVHPGISIPAGLLAKLQQHHIGLVISGGRYSDPVQLSPSRNGLQRRIAQFHAAASPEIQLALSKLLVSIKLRNQIRLLSCWNEDLLVHDLQQYRKTIHTAESIDVLRGIEGNAAAHYFSGMRRQIQAEWNFKKRLYHPSPDPINALLSLGYTLLYNELQLSIAIYGFDPMMGMYHLPCSNRASLACDLQEPLRPIIDEFSLRWLDENNILPSDFSQKDDACWLGDNIKYKYYQAWHGFIKEYRPLLRSIPRRLAHHLARYVPETIIMEE